MHFRRNTDVDGDGVYALTRRTIEQSEARVASLVQRAKADKRLRGSETYAASILAVLAKHPRGLTTAELTAYFRDVRHPIAERSDAAKAVSNQLSQLKAKHLVVRDRQKRFTLQS
jgi:hypothetical protein